ncbi:MAG: PDZ domain-containing protein [Fimbriimonadaceae bacterium]|nr:PDZ domain-containing protein [Fimbriimonadaceae bacterium]
MERRHRFPLLRLVVLTALSLAFSVGYGQPITPEQKKEVLDKLSETVSTRAFVPGVDFSKWPEFVAKRQEGIDKAETIPTFATEVNRALREFGFSHISLRTPQAVERRNQTSAIGVGASVRPTDTGLEVTNVMPKSPADEAGLKRGDLIVEAGGAKPSGPQVLEGEEGSALPVKVKRGDGEPFEITLQRRRFSTVTEDTLTWPEPTIALLRINSFTRGYDQKKVEKMIELAAKAEALVLDLRSNGGGATNNMNHLLSLLMPPDTEFGTFVSRNLADRYRTETGKEPNDPVEIAKWAPTKTKTRKRLQEPYAGKVLVLINRGSASASEIVACALREHRQAPLIGSRSAGAVLASVYGNLAHGFQLQYPVSDYVSSGGIRLEKHPLEPDYAAGTPREGAPDPGVEKAVEVAKTGKKDG